MQPWCWNIYIQNGVICGVSVGEYSTSADAVQSIPVICEDMGLTWSHSSYPSGKHRTNYGTSPAIIMGKLTISAMASINFVCLPEGSDV